MTDSKQDLATWQKVKAALDEALKEPAENRTQRLAELCDDSAVLEQALSVLSAYESATDAFPTPSPMGFGPRLVDASAQETFGPGSEVGPYRIERSLGAGGMGAVYLARRSDRSFDKQVAIKLIKQRWTISDEEISRFRRERQILANLTHPAIAQLLDGGSTPQGYPYLVMEYVEGQTIEEYAKERALSVDQILDLFQQICSAVQFAHQNLIVHRDLKPGNILVDAEGQVKLLDFGIAKILDTKDFGVTIMETRPGSSPMTLAYASPEQVKGEAITTATDVYALGILLFQLLTGHKPYQFDGRNLPAAVDAICHQEVTKPSDTVRKQQQISSSGGSTTQHSAPWRQIQGDLDAIVLKALAKEPQRRYQSAEQLGEDIVRFRSSLPVLARKGTLAYRARKFLRRHRVALSATAAIFAVLVTAILLLLQQQDLLIHQRNRAEAVADWMVNLFESSDPDQARGKEVTVREVLDDSRETIRDDLGHDPLLLHQMLTVLGKTYFSLGLSAEARELTTDALEIAERSGSLEQEIENRLLLARIAYRQGKGREAYDRADEVLALSRASFPRTDPRITRGLITKALAAASFFRYDEVLALCDEIEQLAVEAGDLETLATALDFSSGALSSVGKNLLAEKQLRRSLAIREQVLPENHPDLLKTRVVLTAMQTRKPTQLPLLLEQLEDFRRLFSKDNERVATTLLAAAQAALRAESIDDTRRLYEELLRISTAAWGDEHFHSFTAMSEIGGTYFTQRDYPKATAMYERALALSTKVLGPNTGQAAMIHNQLGIIHLQQGSFEEAESKLLEALSILETLKDTHRDKVIILANLGSIQIRQGHFETARDFFQKAVQEGRNIEGFAKELAASLYNLADSEKRLGLLDEALQHYQEVWELIQDDSSVGPLALCRAASLEVQKGNLDAAEAYIERCVKASEAWSTNRFLKTYPSFLKGLILVERKNYQKAEALLEQVLKQRKELGASQTLIDETEEALARARAGI